MSSATVMYRTGQQVNWPPAPGGVAQVEELRRTHLRLCYRCLSGLLRRPVVSVALVTAMNRVEPPLPLMNPMSRGVLPRAKQFEVIA